jgi:plastocyanin domain-containing protein
MVMLGLKMLGVLPKLPRVGKFVPASIRASAVARSFGVVRRVASSLRKKGPFAVGLLNGLMPCGPLQTMQIYALGTGSAFAGALSMFIFSMGTVPLMLGFGMAAALLPRKFLPVMVRASAVLVMFLGALTFSRAAALAGIDLPSLSLPSIGAGTKVSGAPDRSALVIPVGQNGGSASGGLIAAEVRDGKQTVLTEFGSNGYVPFVVQAGIPLRWTIRVNAENLNGCNNPIQIPAYGIEKRLVPGDNVIEFTPTREGTISYSCWMGMIRSRISAVKDIGAIASLPKAELDALTAPDIGRGGGGGGCCSGSSNPAFAGGKVPTEIIGIPTITDGVQVIEVTVDGQGYTPAAFVLQKGMKAIIKFKPTALTGCNSPVVFPEYNGGLDLQKGQLETPPIPVTADFTFQCGMGMLHGYIKVVDDLAKVDLAKVRAEIGTWKAPGGGGCCGG